MEQLEVGSIVEGKVSGITKFGAFVSLPDGRSGLVHISEISYTYVNDVKDHLQEGQAVKVKLIGVDESGRVNLSIKKAMDPPPRAEGAAPPRPGRDKSPRPITFTGQRKQAEPVTFEDKLKRFMASSDSKLSEHHMNERKGSRRRGGGGRRSYDG